MRDVAHDDMAMGPLNEIVPTSDNELPSRWIHYCEDYYLLN